MVFNGTGTAIHPEHLSSPLDFCGVRVTRTLVLCVCFVDRCLSLCIFLLAIVLSVLRFTAFDYSFGIFKLFLMSRYIRSITCNRSSYQEGRVGILLTGLTTKHVCTCNKLGYRFPRLYTFVFFCIQ